MQHTKVEKIEKRNQHTHTHTHTHTHNFYSPETGSKRKWNNYNTRN